MKVVSTNQQVNNKQGVKKVDVQEKANENKNAEKESKGNTDVAQSEASKTDTVRISEKSAALASAVKADNTSNVTETQKTVTPASQSEAKGEETSEGVATGEKTKTDKSYDIRDVIKSKQRELQQVVSDLKDIGVKRKEIGVALKAANRKANANIADDLKQAYKAYRTRDIDEKGFKDRLYGTVAKKLDGIVSGLKNVYDQKIASSSNNTEITPAARGMASVEKTDDQIKQVKDTDEKKVDEKAASTQIVKANQENDEKVTTAKVKEDDQGAKAVDNPGQTVANNGSGNANVNANVNGTGNGIGNENANANGKGNNNNASQNSQRQVAKGKGGLAAASKQKKPTKVQNVPPGLTKKEILPPGLALQDVLPGNADRVFGGVVSMFNEIDKMVNGLAKKVEDGGVDDMVAGENNSFGGFVKSLNRMFTGVDSAMGNPFMKNLKNVAQANSATDTYKLGMVQLNKNTLDHLFNGGNTGHGFGINRIGDSGEGSGNFNALRFMSLLSNSINDAFENYKELKEATEKKEEKLAKTEDELNTLA